MGINQWAVGRMFSFYFDEKHAQDASLIINCKRSQKGSEFGL
jgi:hypothetical protein